MGRRVNLCPNPALKNDAAGWFFPSGYGRSTAVTTLPRSTGLKGTSAPTGSLISPKCAVVTGQPYCVSFSIHYTNSSGTNNYDYGIDWYKPNGDYLATTAYDHRQSAPFGITERLEFGPVTAPAGAGSGVLVLTDLDSGCEVTAVLFEQTGATGQAYFDGDTAGASWNGTVGNSTSQQLKAVDAWTWADAAGKAATAAGPTGADGFAWSDAASVLASVPAAETWTVTDAAIVLSLGYDERRGRVRLSAFGLPTDAVRAAVDSRVHGTTAWTAVRGGKVTITAGGFARTVDDYEFASGLATDYRVTVYRTAEGVPDDVVISATVTQPPIAPQVWLKFIPAPLLNRRVTLTRWGPIARTSRNVAYDVRGRTDPVVITDVHSSRRVTISVRTQTIEEGDRLDQALSAGMPAFLHTPAALALPSMYVAIGDYSSARPSSYSPVRSWSLDLVEVAAPPPAVFGPPTTWRAITGQYQTWAQLRAAFATWRDVMDG